MPTSTNIPDAVVPNAPTGAPAGARAAGASRSTLDPQAVQRAKQEIQDLAREIAELARSDISPSEFYEAMLTRIVAALAAEGGAVWAIGEGGRLELVYQTQWKKAWVGVDNEQAQSQYAALLQNVVTTGEASLVPPHSSAGDDATAANPTDYLLVLAPLKNDESVQGVVGILQRAEVRPTTQRGYLRFVQQMCELAGDFLKTRRLRHFTDKQTLWEQLDNFAFSVHESLDTRHVSYVMANEARRLVGCDRVSVALRRRSKCVVEAISGQDAFEPRSNLVTRLADLANAVAATGETMWYTGEMSHLAPQVERALEAYLDVAHSKMVVVLPLSRHQADLQPQTEPKIVGALVIEQIENSQPSDGLPKRIEAVGRHGAEALANALEHQSLFLLPVWRALGRMRWVTRARTLPKTLAVAGVVAVLLSAVLLVPADFELEARGILQPANRREVFAGIDGVVTEVSARHGAMVAEGEVLARLRNTPLDIQITDLVGRREATDKQINALSRALLDRNQMSIEEQNRLSGQLLMARESHASYERQLDLLRQKQAELEIKSPIGGQLVTWQVRERLLRRPVRQGQVLMSVTDPQGPWELELYMPEDRMGHVSRAASQRQEPLEVTYILATQPGDSHVGRVTEMHARAEVRGEEGNTVLLRVAIDKTQLEDLRLGASVTAKVDCGRRSLGYVWLHDLLAFIQSRVLFRL